MKYILTPIPRLTAVEYIINQCSNAYKRKIGYGAKLTAKVTKSIPSERGMEAGGRGGREVGEVVPL